jgi:protein-tyrosine-phosphatase
MKILFVCTGNIFRSMSAEYLAKKYITDNNIKNIKVNSAGTIAEIQNPFSYTVKCLEKY